MTQPCHHHHGSKDSISFFCFLFLTSNVYVARLYIRSHCDTLQFFGIELLGPSGIKLGIEVIAYHMIAIRKIWTRTCFWLWLFSTKNENDFVKNNVAQLPILYQFIHRFHYASNQSICLWHEEYWPQSDWENNFGMTLGSEMKNILSILLRKLSILSVISLRLWCTKKTCRVTGFLRMVGDHHFAEFGGQRISRCWGFAGWLDSWLL